MSQRGIIISQNNYQMLKMKKKKIRRKEKDLKSSTDLWQTSGSKHEGTQSFAPRRLRRQPQKNQQSARQRVRASYRSAYDLQSIPRESASDIVPSWCLSRICALQQSILIQAHNFIIKVPSMKPQRGGELRQRGRRCTRHKGRQPWNMMSTSSLWTC